MSPEEIRAAACTSVWQLGALTRESRERDIDRVAHYIATGSWEIEDGRPRSW